MFNLWSRGNRTLTLGPAEDRLCPTCGTRRPFTLLLNYRLHHLWFFFRWVTAKAYQVRCTVCGNTMKVDAAEAEARLPANPIPAYDRRSGAFALAGLVIALSIGTVEEINDRFRMAPLVQAPRIGDLYVMDRSRLADPPGSWSAYSVFRVRALARGGVEMQFGHTIFSHADEADRDIAEGQARRDDYYDPGTRTISIEGLSRLLNDGAIYDVVR
jgi:hypothetical protein